MSSAKGILYTSEPMTRPAVIDVSSFQADIGNTVLNRTLLLFPNPKKVDGIPANDHVHMGRSNEFAVANEIVK
jgi:hypothetical protein